MRHGLKLSYPKPAADWLEALPIGNGRLGGMVFGGSEKEIIQLNEITLWSGRVQHADNPEGAAHVSEIRQLLFQKKYAEAQALAEKSLKCIGMGTNCGDSAYSDFGAYQPLGMLSLYFGGYRTWTPSSYQRFLDLNTGICHVNYSHRSPYSHQRVSYEREVFASYPDQALIMRIIADQPGSIDAAVRLQREREASVSSAETGRVFMRGQIGGGMRFECHVGVLQKGGELVCDGDGLWVRKADELVLVLVANTGYYGKDPSVSCREQLDSVMKEDYSRLKENHISDYQNLFNRVDLELGTGAVPEIHTPELLDSAKNGSADPYLSEIYFHYGRYLLMSCSRPGALPANIQGMWNDKYHPAWSCDYHFNVNTQMAYWLAEPANLSECHLPLLDFIDSLREPGRRTARVHFNARGWCVSWLTNVWGFTSPGESLEWGLFPEAGAWLCRHLWDHYDFTRDAGFLKRAYPAIRESCEFCLDFLIEDPERHWLVFGPSVAPEHGYMTARNEHAFVAMGTAVSQQIVRDVFRLCIRASEILETDGEFREELRKKLDRLAPVLIDKDGEIQKWTDDLVSDGAQHMRHTYAHYPGDEITIAGTPELAAAIRRTLETHEKHSASSYWGAGSWSAGWLINHWARLHDGERAYSSLNALLGRCTAPNLFDLNSSIFQIDGNLGAAAGIIEMLMQSHANEICLLPALPGAWRSGHVKGLRARGGYEVDIEWSDGLLLRAQVKSLAAGELALRYRDKLRKMTTVPGGVYILNSELE